MIVALLSNMTMSATIPLDLNDVFGLHFFLAPDFQIYQLFTYMFMHGGFTHLFFNMFALWMFGCIVEKTWGSKRFLFYYIVCGVGAGLFQEMAQFGEFIMMCKNQIPDFEYSNILTIAENSGAMLNRWTTVGASGSVYGILLAFGMLYPEHRMYIIPLPIPIKAKWFVIFYAAVELFLAIGTTSDGVAHIAHLGGMAFGFFLIRYWRNHSFGGYAAGNRNGFFADRFNKRQYNGSNFDTTYTSSPNYEGTSSTRTSSDWEYNADKRAKQNEIDAILDRIRKSGYDSLTKEEKQKLFDASRN